VLSQWNFVRYSQHSFFNDTEVLESSPPADWKWKVASSSEYWTAGGWIADIYILPEHD